MSEDRHVQDGLWKEGAKGGPVECLGMTFESDEARRAHFTEKLRGKLQDPEFRKIEGFPIGEDEDILALSDPPYYTACPNPFIEDFVRCYGKPYDPEHDDYQREPYAADVSEGKGDAIYSAHSYHTKVPHKAIMRYILHYTEPGDIVYDGFCGSGMTGVGAQLCGDRKAVEELGYRVQEDGTILDEHGDPFSQLGARRAVLGDLSPAATFIAYNYNVPVDVRAFQREARRILRELDDEIGWMYETWHPRCDDPDRVKARINYMVWSQVFLCPECGEKLSFVDVAFNAKSKRVRSKFGCPHCGVELSKGALEAYRVAALDAILGEAVDGLRRVPALMEYTFAGSKHTKRVDALDLKLLQRISQLPPVQHVPSVRFPIERMYHGSRLAPKGITHTHQLFLPRSARALAALWAKSQEITDWRLRHFMLYTAEQAIWGMSVLNRFGPTHFSQVNRYLTGVYYVPSLTSEVSPWYILDGKTRRLAQAFATLRSHTGNAVVATQSATLAWDQSDIADYVFTDPPFGENIPYADLNYVVESWHRVWTNSSPEAIVDRAKRKDLQDYEGLMVCSFVSFHRRLKAGRWITVVFHNSHNAVWNAIQQALWSAGFVVADVRTLDKQAGSYRQVTSAHVMKQDLVISAYKPDRGLSQRFELQSGTEDGAWDFVRSHLRQLPIMGTQQGKATVNPERTRQLLYDRMVAFHVQRGVTVPLSAPEFFLGLERRFAKRDGMYFVPEQVAEYDRKRMEAKELVQLQLLVSDEESAIQWLRLQLDRKPQTLQDLTPQFMREIAAWDRYEKSLELSVLLEQNFLCYDGVGPVPVQVYEFLAEQHHGVRTSAPDDPTVMGLARDLWYVPDPNRASDLEKLRERALLREFDGYRTSDERDFKVLRLEAVRAGFKRAWQERDYATILDVAKKIPHSVLEEDPKLLMWYEQARTRLGED